MIARLGLHLGNDYLSASPVHPPFPSPYLFSHPLPTSTLAPSTTRAPQHPLPALYLHPLNDSFIPRHIHLPRGQQIKIGRQINAETAPGECNGFFDSKVLSRQHAEIWEDSGKTYIKDTKSSNGTFINGEKLSVEGAESEPFELKTSNIVEFGIDIPGVDNKTIMHHKVAACVVCMFTNQDSLVRPPFPSESPSLFSHPVPTPMPAPFTAHAPRHPLPALDLYPLNDSFIPKHIHLPQGQRIKIARQTDAKTAPEEHNGFFDSKVLSRQHAEIWEDSGKIYIKDTKSSNGTFINGKRLGAGGAESEPFELMNNDIVEFGIDIVGEDNKTIVHHKIAARVVCEFTLIIWVC